ncbi:MAG: S-layer homology domain-containing protein, partial [Clostridia bacterium]|nr:S-layer homology domain-containing protein [Clostridia bacterium]
MKRAIVMLMISAIILSLSPLTSLAGFDDVSDQPTQAAASLLQNLGIVEGFDDGSFRPDDILTRAQFCKMAVMLSGTQGVPSYEGYTIFPDVLTGHWGKGYVNVAVRALK